MWSAGCSSFFTQHQLRVACTGVVWPNMAQVAEPARDGTMVDGRIALSTALWDTSLEMPRRQDVLRWMCVMLEHQTSGLRGTQPCCAPLVTRSHPWSTCRRLVGSLLLPCTWCATMVLCRTCPDLSTSCRSQGCQSQWSSTWIRLHLENGARLFQCRLPSFVRATAGRNRTWPRRRLALTGVRVL